MSPRWRKVLRDLGGNITRTILVVLSIAVGVFAVGMILGTNTVLGRDLNSNYVRCNPSAASIYTQGFDDEFVDAMRNVPGVADAEGRYDTSVRIRLGSNVTRNLAIIYLPRNGKTRINEVWPQEGQFPPPARTIVLERASLAWLGLNVGDRITVEAPDGKTRELRISGTVHYINLPPASFAGSGYAFATAETLEWLGAGRQYTELQITVTDDPLNKAHIQEVATAVRHRVEATGRSVFGVYIPDPGKYPGDSAVQALLMLLGLLGSLALILSGFLVVNTVSALLTQQTRQIGVMKAVGARNGQIVGMYLATVLGFGALALLVGIPLGLLASNAFVGYLAGLLNFDVTSYVPGPEVFLVEVAVGLAVPVFAALWPVVGGTRISVRQALSGEGASRNPSQGLVDRIVGRVRFLSRPLLLSLRNTFRRKGRLALTLSTLTLAGAIFIAVLCVHSSTVTTLDDALAYFHYDVEIGLDQPARGTKIKAEAARVPGVADVEVLAGSTVRRIRPDKTESNGLNLLALPADTPFIQPTLLEGRWLLPEDENAVVVNTLVLKDEKDIQVGNDITLKVDGKEGSWKVVGVVRGVMTGAIVYANQPYFWRLTDNPGRTASLWVVGDRHDPASQQQLSEALEGHFKSVGMAPSRISTIAFTRTTIQGQFDIIVIFLMVMSVLLAVVGGLGLMGTMSLNVLERTREIGVMRAIGASNASVRQVFITEAVIIAVVSWIVGALVSFPVSRLLSDQVGVLFIQSPLSYTFSVAGAGGWLVCVVTLAVLASIVPARNASRLTVRDVLAYQ